MTKNVLEQLEDSFLDRKKSSLLAKELLKKESKFSEFMELFFSDDNRICQMASFPILVIADLNMDILGPYVLRMLDHYRYAPHDSFRRNVVRILQFSEIPEALEGRVFDLCMEEFTNTKVATAIRVFSSTVLVNICEKHPDLRQELEPLLLDFQGTGTVGFENRLSKEIVRLRKIKPVDPSSESYT